MEIKFKPIDPVFFRNGRPFTMGEETWAESNFPPSPSVLYGALRTALSTVNKKEIHISNITEELNSKSLKINQIYYLIDNAMHFPLPMDYAKGSSGTQNNTKKDTKSDEVVLSHLVHRKGIISSEKDILLKFIAVPKAPRSSYPEGHLLASKNLLEYLNHEAPLQYARSINDFLVDEPKIGNGRDNQTKSVEESLLYRVGMQRLVNIEIGMALQIEKQYSLSEINGLQVRLGGEGKIAVINSANDGFSFQEEVEKIKLQTGFFKLYFSTPAIIDNETKWPKLGINAQLVSACIGKFQSIGGYDLILNKPKTMFKAIPAGSVLYYTTTEKPETIQKLQGQSFSDQRKEEGFGIAYFGNFTPPV